MNLGRMPEKMDFKKVLVNFLKLNKNNRYALHKYKIMIKYLARNLHKESRYNYYLK